MSSGLYARAWLREVLIKSGQVIANEVKQSRSIDLSLGYELPRPASRCSQSSQ